MSVEGHALKVGVLALQGDVAEHLLALQAVGVSACLVKLPSDLEGLHGLILPGGESTTVGKLLRRFDLLVPLQNRVQDGFPMYGTCAGMILMADEVLGFGKDQPTIGGMDITVERNAFGRQPDSFEVDLQIKLMDGDPFHAVFIRAPRIVKTGSGIEILARLPDNTPVAARQGSLLVSSFHPELTPDLRFHRLFLDLLSTQVGASSTMPPKEAVH